MAWGDYGVLPQLSGFTDSSLPSIDAMKTYGMPIGYNSSNRQQYNVALDGYFVKIAYLRSSYSYLGIILACKHRGANDRVGAYLRHIDIGGNEYYEGPNWNRIILTYSGTNDTFYYDYGTNIGSVWPDFRNPDIPVYEASSMSEAATLALAAMDDGIWEEPPTIQDKLITRLAIKLDFPDAGDALASSGSAEVDQDSVTVAIDSITWDPADTEAKTSTAYKATVTISADARFNSGIEPTVINTGQGQSTYVQGVSRPIFDPETPNVITYTISFGPTGIKDPYAVDRDEESDQVPDPALPSLAATSTGFLAIYQPTLSQLKQLATYMWSDSFIDTLKKLVSDPFQTILGLSIVPVQAPSGGSSNVILGNVDTGISMSKVATQYVTVNCGTLTLEEKYRSYLDYNPNTKTWIYLPYIGIQAIDVDTIMNTSIEVIYKVDVLSGACLCNVLANGTVIGSYAGACASQLPITSMQFSSALTGLAQLTGGLVSVTVGSATGNIAASIVGGINAVQGTANIMKSNIEKSNRLGSTAGLMAVQYPYLIIQRPRQALPNAQNHYTGYPSFQTFTIGNLRGYTEVANIDLSGITATQKELDELKAMLSEGVYF